MRVSAFGPWMQGGVYPNMPFNQQVTFPRELTLRSTPAGPRLFRQPIREIEALYDGAETWTNRTLRAGQTLPLMPVGDLFRLQMSVNIDDGATLMLNARGVKLVFTRQSMSCTTKPVPCSTALTNIDVLIDRTSVETFANAGEASMTKCFLSTENGLSLRASNGSVLINEARLIHLKSAWD